MTSKPDPAADDNPIAAALGITDDPADFEPAGRDLVIVDPFDRAEKYVVMDRHDEQLMLQELQGRVLDVMLYSFPGDDGKTMTDLSVQGVNEAVRVMNNTGRVKITIHPSSLSIVTATEDVGNGAEECWVATVYAQEQRTGYGMYGTFVQAKRMYLTASAATRRRQKRKEAGKPSGVADDNSVANPFSRQTALNKAQRNAFRAMIPERIRQALIAQYVGDAKRVRVIEVGAGAINIADLPPKLVDDKAEAQRAEITRVYDALHAKDPLAVLPAQLYAYQVRADHSHETLAKLIGYLRDKCAAAGVEVPDADA